MNANVSNIINFNPKYATHGDPRERLAQRFWEVVRVVVWGLSPWFARGWRAAWFRIFGGKIAGGGISLGRKARLDFPWNITIGEASSIADGSLIRASCEIDIGRNVCISEGVKILTASHDISSPHFNLVRRPVRVSDNVWIAMNAIILPGVTIGEGAVIAAGAVVTKSVAAWSVVGGNPAKAIKRRVVHE